MPNQRIAGAFHYAAGTIYAGLASLLGPFLLLGADIDPELEQLLRLRHGLRFEHPGGPQLHLHEVVDRDLLC